MLHWKSKGAQVTGKVKKGMHPSNMAPALVRWNVPICTLCAAQKRIILYSKPMIPTIGPDMRLVHVARWQNTCVRYWNLNIRQVETFKFARLELASRPQAGPRFNIVLSHST